jgi:hypothetical protein
MPGNFRLCFLVTRWDTNVKIQAKKLKPGMVVACQPPKLIEEFARTEDHIISGHWPCEEMLAFDVDALYYTMSMSRSDCPRYCGFRSLPSRRNTPAPPGAAQHSQSPAHTKPGRRT